MRERSAIEWTDSSWNPVTGCTGISPGCDNCYALRLAAGRLQNSYLDRAPVVDTAEARADPFAVRTWAERLSQPAKWKDRRRIFVNSMSDLFHEDIPEPFLRRIFETMLEVDRHVYQVLTKRPARALRFVRRNKDLLPKGFPKHVWLGASVEDERVLHRIRHLRQVPAAVRFLSCEPLLGPLQLDLDGIDWVIVGGESGPQSRRMEASWAEDIQRQCASARVPFFFKQWGGRTPKAGGRQLRGQEWNEYPAEESTAALIRRGKP